MRQHLLWKWTCVLGRSEDCPRYVGGGQVGKSFRQHSPISNEWMIRLTHWHLGSGKVIRTIENLGDL